eukprot:CAMPEP_0201524618 /NCGR_PEP_ID=MMETSP0161_2-20130828/23837_1 /ASSEMBLY_ACC=CAM_ASM_000251 /TAXON_ID=180227 /ORGANISM="Neoparamoeba aestuarina, Strain SoJaBio B1-5/56/2" /LENGTH=293 /DNA_ID=CAMNT_0047924109 /DNA_START=38 /DNA_END=916 /DNA_ORIENTATION=-
MEITNNKQKSCGDDDPTLSTSAPPQSSLLLTPPTTSPNVNNNNKKRGTRTRSKSSKGRNRNNSVKNNNKNNNNKGKKVNARKDNPGETTEVFPITVKIKRSPGMFATLKYYHIKNDEDLDDVYQEERMLMSKFCKREIIAKLWAQKDLLDDLFDQNDGQSYYNVRDKLYPEEKGGGGGAGNRTGRKFEQILEAVPILKGLNDIFFLDVCGAPGSFSQVLLHRDTHSPFRGKGRGWGVSLLQKGGGPQENWHQSLVRSPNFSIIKDGGGNIFKPAVVTSVHRLLTQEGGKKKGK